MASLNDVLTSAQNIVTAISTASQAYLNVNGSRVSSGVSVATVASASPGRLAVVSVTAAGTGAGAIYDANATGVTTNPLYTIPMAVGVVFVNLPVINGIVIAPGTGQVVTVSYS